jgi:peptidoglycan hydrolase CwlO-like protein
MKQNVTIIAKAGLFFTWVKETRTKLLTVAGITYFATICFLFVTTKPILDSITVDATNKVTFPGWISNYVHARTLSFWEKLGDNSQWLLFPALLPSGIFLAGIIFWWYAFQKRKNSLLLVQSQLEKSKEEERRLTNKIHELSQNLGDAREKRDDFKNQVAKETAIKNGLQEKLTRMETEFQKQKEELSLEHGRLLREKEDHCNKAIETNNLKVLYITEKCAEEEIARKNIQRDNERLQKEVEDLKKKLQSQVGESPSGKGGEETPSGGDEDTPYKVL